MARVRASSSPAPVQAKLLRERGDLGGKRAHFDVHLSEPTPLALLAESPFTRIGMELKRANVADRLLITSIDENPKRKTPVARWNTEEDRRADRGEEEQHASLALVPGDRLRAVNDIGGKTAMLAELEAATSFTSPKNVNLVVSRDLGDVLQPLIAQSDAVQPGKVSRPSTASPFLTGLPPRAPQASAPVTPIPAIRDRGRERGSVSSAGSVLDQCHLRDQCHQLQCGINAASHSTSRVSSACSSRSTSCPGSRAGSRPASRSGSARRYRTMCGQTVGVRTSLSQVGRLQLAF